MTLTPRELYEVRRLAKKVGGWDELRRLAEQVRSPGRAPAEYDADILAAYDAALKEEGFLPPEVLALSDRARMLWFLKTVGFVQADRPGLEYALKSGRLGKGTKNSIVKRLTRKRHKAK